MMSGPTARKSVFMVIGASVRDGVAHVSPFVATQAASVREVGWEVFLGVVDDRTSLRGVLRNVRRLRREIAKANPGVVHPQYGSVTAAVGALLKGQTPLVVSFCGSDLQGTRAPGLIWRMRDIFGRQIGLHAARHAGGIIVKSRNLFRALPRDLRDRAIILPNGVDTRWFRPLDQQECRAKLGWPIQAKIVLFNNNNEYVKNPKLARAAVDIVSRSVAGVHLHMISKASREEVLLMLNAADCLLVTSYLEGSPNIVKEAMACNLPVVSVACGDVAERLQSTFPGRVCEDTPGGLAEAMEEVFKTRSRSNGRQQLEAQGLTAAEVAKRLAGIYRAVQLTGILRKEAC